MASEYRGINRDGPLKKELTMQSKEWQRCLIVQQQLQMKRTNLMAIAADYIGGVTAPSKTKPSLLLSKVKQRLCSQHVMHRAPPYRNRSLWTARSIFMPHLPCTPNFYLFLFYSLHTPWHLRWCFLLSINQMKKKKLVI